MSCDSSETRFCSNCRHNISSGNYLIHSGYCLRNIYLCSKCDEPVNVNSKKEHEEIHLHISCSDCGQKVENRAMEMHKSEECSKRKLNCHICEMEVVASEMNEHENYCGSRTEKCPGCQEVVMMKYKLIHLETDHNFIKLPDESGPSPSVSNPRQKLGSYLHDIPAGNNRYSNQKRKSPAVHSKNSSWRPKISSSENMLKLQVEKWDYGRETSFSKNDCGQTTLPSNCLGAKKKTFKTEKKPFTETGKNIDNKGNLAEQTSQTALKSFSDTASYASKTAAESFFKQDYLPKQSILKQKDDNVDLEIAHSLQLFQKCNISNNIENNSNIQNSKYDKNLSKTNDTLHGHNLVDFVSHSEDNKPKLTTKNFQRSVDYDGVLCDFSDHLKSPSQEPVIPCPYCSALFPIEEYELHEKECAYTRSFNRERKPSDNSSVEEIIVECSFCHQNFKAELLNEHEVVCGERRYTNCDAPHKQRNKKTRKSSQRNERNQSDSLSNNSKSTNKQDNNSHNQRTLEFKNSNGEQKRTQYRGGAQQ